MSSALMWLLDGIAKIPASDARVADLTLDSRQVRPGSLFFALPGLKEHGLKFAADAAARGASVVLWEPSAARGGEASPAALPPGVFAAAVPNLKSLVGRIADRFFNWPSSQLRITGITGTNGKTTSAYLLAQCLERLGNAAAYMGTIGWGRPAALTEPTHTTPDAVSVHRILAQLRSAGVREVAMEVSSHALDQSRVDGVRFHAAAFTNLTRDHLDYHGSMQEYGAAKAKLFQSADLKHIVLNLGDEFGRALARDYSGGASLIAVWVGAGDSGWLADRRLHATQVRTEPRGISIEVDGSFGKAQVKTQLMGRFNAENSLVVIGCLLSLGVSLAEAAETLADCKPAPGRMEVVKADARNKPTVVVDYAHTPDALAKALSAAREHCEGALWCVFGCGGDRDPGKRPVMGSIAESLADRIIVTDDNPRSEDPQAITQDIVKGIKSRTVRVIHDRGEAIATALREANAADLVLIAGKGHEDYQIYGETRRSFSDRTEALRYLGAAA
ncbi:MAG TPA: UDP-N-acetylmuramoyl-L-alanyl-D-glutamate--2,6-diaminopimelate ligase [Steroidobacteraceae bacterium]|nr:UDP-N-acetylmuramoyl-L-alanyl-D-glutamate--2,6-diaminopimelate ligase [Steroidobacteraceae bacterium]